MNWLTDLRVGGWAWAFILYELFSFISDGSEPHSVSWRVSKKQTFFNMSNEYPSSGGAHAHWSTIETAAILAASQSRRCSSSSSSATEYEHVSRVWLVGRTVMQKNDPLSVIVSHFYARRFLEAPPNLKPHGSSPAQRPIRSWVNWSERREEGDRTKW